MLITIQKNFLGNYECDRTEWSTNVRNATTRWNDKPAGKSAGFAENIELVEELLSRYGATTASATAP